MWVIIFVIFQYFIQQIYQPVSIYLSDSLRIQNYRLKLHVWWFNLLFIPIKVIFWQIYPNKDEKLIESFYLELTIISDWTNNITELRRFLYEKLYDFQAMDFFQFNEMCDDQLFEKRWLIGVDYDHKDRKYFICPSNWYQMSIKGDGNQFRVFS